METSKKIIVKEVMLIDDNHTDNYIHTKVLEYFNFADSIKVYNSCLDALKYFEEHQSKTEKLPDLIFLNLILPGLDGFDFLLRFDKFPEEVKKKSKIVILSTNEGYDREKCIGNERIIDYLQKPLSFDGLEKIKGSLVQTNLN